MLNKKFIFIFLFLLFINLSLIYCKDVINEEYINISNSEIIRREGELYKKIIEEYNIIEETGEPILPRDYVDYDVNEMKNIIISEIINDFDFETYKSMIKEINFIMGQNAPRATIINNLNDYEVGNFELLYSLHRIMLRLNEEKKKIILDIIKLDKVFISFFKNAPEYAESTLLAEILQTFSFINKRVNL